MFGLELKDERRATLRFEKFPTFAHDRLLAALQNIEKRLEAAVIAAEPEKTGALRSMTGGRVYDHGDRMAAVVGVRAPDANAAKKAGALEYGSRGVSFAVKAHQMSLDHVYSRARSGPAVMVPAYSRTADIVAQRFLRGPIDAIRADAVAELQAAMNLAIQDADAV